MVIFRNETWWNQRQSSLVWVLIASGYCLGVLVVSLYLFGLFIYLFIYLFSLHIYRCLAQWLRARSRQHKAQNVAFIYHPKTSYKVSSHSFNHLLWALVCCYCVSAGVVGCRLTTLKPTSTSSLFCLGDFCSVRAFSTNLVLACFLFGGITPYLLSYLLVCLFPRVVPRRYKPVLILSKEYSAVPPFMAGETRISPSWVLEYFSIT